MSIPFKQTLSKDQGLEKLKHYCAYQERCHQEVKDKLYSLGLHRKDVDDIIATLIEENYLNEERFAIQYAGSKFRMKHWGKIKIKYSLRQKQVSDYCINKALKQIPRDDYFASLVKLAEQKRNLLSQEQNSFVLRKKIQDYLMQKGYESEMIREVVNDLLE